MWNSTAEERPHKIRKTSYSSSSWSSLPDDLTLSCLARVSKSDQTALCRVSKRFGSLVASHELHKTRSLMGRTENCLYVCLLTPRDPTPRWFILCRGGNRLLRPIPSPHSQAREGSSVVVLDYGIYVIGGLNKGNPTSEVWLLDCRSHKWRRVPSMGVGRSSAAAGVVDGKIYVFGGCLNPESSNWAEVFDPNTQTWDTLSPMPDRKTRVQYIQDSMVVKDEKVYAVDLMEKSYYYSPSEGKWRKGNHAQVLLIRRDRCLIDKIIYSCDPCGSLCWCEEDQLEPEEPELMYWRRVKGLEFQEKRLSNSRLVHFDGILDDLWETRKIGYGRHQKLIDLLPGFRLSNSGPNIVLFWDLLIPGVSLEIWCAEISLEKRTSSQGPEIWGNIEWSSAVMTLHPFSQRYKVLHSVSLNL